MFVVNKQNFHIRSFVAERFPSGCAPSENDRELRWKILYSARVKGLNGSIVGAYLLASRKQPGLACCTYDPRDPLFNRDWMSFLDSTHTPFCRRGIWWISALPTRLSLHRPIGHVRSDYIERESNTISARRVFTGKPKSMARTTKTIIRERQSECM